MVSTLALSLLIGLQTKTPEQKVVDLQNDLRQTMTLAEQFMAKAKNQQEQQKLVQQLWEKLSFIAKTAQDTQKQAKSVDTMAKLAIVRFEALCSAGIPSESVVKLADEVADQFRESPGMSDALEKLTFFRFLTPDNYDGFADKVKESRNPEVLASLELAGQFIDFAKEEGDVNKFLTISQKYPKTKAGARSAIVHKLRTKVALDAPMPEITFEPIGGPAIKTSALLGKVVVIDFWGFWSAGSVTQLEFARQYLAQNPGKVVWIGVNTDSCTQAYLEQRLKEQKITWRTVYTGGLTGRLPMDFGITTYPSKIIIDSFGLVKYVPSNRDWREALDVALGRKVGQ